MFDNFLSPLGKEYCAYFYWLTVFSFIFVIVGIFIVLKSVIIGDFNELMINIFNFLIIFLMYFNNRLLYSMCVK
jgi:hypothetical protein